MHPTVALFKRNAWATDRLLNWCAWQQPEVVGAVADDVYGSIAAMFNHILGAETRYLRLLTGELPDDPVHESKPRSLNDLFGPAGLLNARWDAILGADRDIEVLRPHERSDGRVEMPDWLPLVQSFHHGDDHRAQIGTLLGRQDVIAPELDGWMFGWYAGVAPPPPPWADGALSRAVGHHLWATEQLLARAQELSEAQLAAAAPGTYGSVAETLGHLVESDRSYLSRLRRAGMAPTLETNEPRELARGWRQLGEEWRDYLAASPDFEATVECRDGWYPAWVLVMQAIHHGNDHRAHLGTVLLHHGIEAPGLDVWAYAGAEGLLREIA